MDAAHMTTTPMTVDSARLAELEAKARTLEPWRYDHAIGDRVIVRGNPVSAPIHGSYGRGAETMRHIVQRLAANLDMSTARALDLGCLEGHYTDILCTAGFKEVVAVDLSPEHLARVEFLLREVRGHANARIVHGNVEDAALLESLGRFDVILFHGLLYHLTDPVTFVQRLSKLGTKHHALLLSTQFKFAYADIISEAPLASIKFRKALANADGQVVYEGIDSTYATHATRLNPKSVHAMLQHVGFREIVGYDTPLGARYGYQLHVVASPAADQDLLGQLSKDTGIDGLGFHRFDGSRIDGVDFRKDLVPRISRFVSKVSYFTSERLGTSGARHADRQNIPDER